MQCVGIKYTATSNEAADQISKSIKCTSTSNDIADQSTPFFVMEECVLSRMCWLVIFSDVDPRCRQIRVADHWLTTIASKKSRSPVVASAHLLWFLSTPPLPSEIWPISYTLAPRWTDEKQINSAKASGGNCLLFKWAVTAVWFCKVEMCPRVLH